MLSSGAGVEPVNTSEIEQVRELSRAFDPSDLLLALETITLARQRLIANGAPLLVVEAMMIGLILPRAQAGARR